MLLREDLSGLADAPGYRSWSSADVAPDEQFAYWSEKSSEVFGPLRTTRDVPGGFAMEIVQTRVGALTLSSLSAQAHRAERDQAMADRDPTGLVFVSVSSSGVVNAKQISRILPLAVGGAGMISVEQPATIEAASDFHQLVLGLPAELVVPRLADAQAVGVATGVLPALLTEVANVLFRTAPSLGESDAQFLAHHVADLVVASFRESDHGSHPRRLILQSAMDEAMRRLSDPSLAVSDLAAYVNVSRRTLEKLFAARGLTAARWILERRLEGVRQELASDAARDLSVAMVAERWGFVDRTSFSRAFRQRFDCAPGAYRRANRPH